MKIPKGQSEALKRLIEIDKNTEDEQIAMALNIYITLRTLSTVEQTEITEITDIIGKQFKDILDENNN